VHPLDGGEYAPLAVLHLKEDAERTLACVNACEGLNPEAVPAVLDAAQAINGILSRLLCTSWALADCQDEELCDIIACLDDEREELQGALAKVRGE
jgi:hypothetical protein